MKSLRCICCLEIMSSWNKLNDTTYAHGDIGTEGCIILNTCSVYDRIELGPYVTSNRKEIADSLYLQLLSKPV
jgi:hypothetical protein